LSGTFATYPVTSVQRSASSGHYVEHENCRHICSANLPELYCITVRPYHNTVDFFFHLLFVWDTRPLSLEGPAFTFFLPSSVCLGPAFTVCSFTPHLRSLGHPAFSNLHYVLSSIFQGRDGLEVHLKFMTDCGWT
jgi:hypothetical protein